MSFHPIMIIGLDPWIKKSVNKYIVAYKGRGGGGCYRKLMKQLIFYDIISIT